MYMFVVYLFIFYKLIICSHRTHTYMCLHFVAVLSIRMANKVNIPSKNSALIAMIADEVRMLLSLMSSIIELIELILDVYIYSLRRLGLSF